MNWSDIKKYVPWAGGGLLVVGIVIAVLVFLPQSCDRIATSATVSMQTFNEGMRNGAAFAKEINNALQGKKDSLEEYKEKYVRLEAKLAKIESRVEYRTEIVYVPVNDTTFIEYPVERVVSVGGDIDLHAEAVLTETLLDGRDTTYRSPFIFPLTVYCGLDSTELIPRGVPVIPIPTRELIITEHVDWKYWVGSALAILVAYTVGGAVK